MREPDCEHEEAVIGALTAGEWTPQLQSHVGGCVSCRDAVRLLVALRKLAAESKHELPSAGYVWWKSRMRQRREAQRRVTRLIAITQRVMLTIAVIGLAVWMVWGWSEIAREIKGLKDSFAIWPSSSLASSAVVLVYLSIALLLVNVLLTVRAVVTNNKSE